jgi:hypothetical protein
MLPATRPPPLGRCHKSCFTWQKEAVPTLTAENQERGLPTQEKRVEEMALDRCMYDMHVPASRYRPTAAKLLPLWKKTRLVMVEYLQSLNPSEEVLAEYQKIATAREKPPVMSLILRVLNEADEETFACLPAYGGTSLTADESSTGPLLATEDEQEPPVHTDGHAGQGGPPPPIAHDNAAAKAEADNDLLLRIAQITATKWAEMSVAQKVWCVRRHAPGFRPPDGAGEVERSRLANERWEAMDMPSRLRCLHSLAETAAPEAGEAVPATVQNMDERRDTPLVLTQGSVDVLPGSRPSRAGSILGTLVSSLGIGSSTLTQQPTATPISSPATPIPSPATSQQPVSRQPTPVQQPASRLPTPVQQLAVGQPTPTPVPAVQLDPDALARRATARHRALLVQRDGVFAGARASPPRLPPLVEYLSSLEAARDAISADADGLTSRIFRADRLDQLSQLGFRPPVGETRLDVSDAGDARRQLRAEVGRLNDSILEALTLYSSAVLSIVGPDARQGAREVGGTPKREAE